VVVEEDAGDLVSKYKKSEGSALGGLFWLLFIFPVKAIWEITVLSAKLVWFFVTLPFKLFSGSSNKAESE
jgi:hypothetical protein